MPFDDLAAFIRPGFELPVRGTKYFVPAPSVRDGLWLQSIVDAGESLLVTGAISAANKVILDDDQERTAYHMALGAAYGQMLADGVEWPIVRHAAMVAILYWTRGSQMAEARWALYQGSGDVQGEAPTQPQEPAAGSPTDQSTPAPA